MTSGPHNPRISVGGVAILSATLAMLSAAALVVVAPTPASGQTSDSRGAGAVGEGTGVDLPVIRHTLDNGMRVLVLPREGTSTVSFVVRYGVGSIHETVGSTGVAHVLEHLLFKGTTTLGTRNLEAERELFRRMDRIHDALLAERTLLSGPDTSRIRVLRDSISVLEDRARVFVESNAFDRILSENGARNLNASTGPEGTTYYVDLPANRTKLWFVLEADRMANPVFREFYSERDVVTEERRSRIDDSPGGRLMEEHLATIFRAHPYGVPVIGYMSDLETLSRERVRSYYDEFYGARNAVVAVVGAIEPDSVAAWSRAYLGRVRPGSTPTPVLTEEPEQRGERRAEVVMDAEPQVLVGWPTVDAFHPDAPALSVLGSILTGGRTARLQRRLIQEDRTATFVGSSQGPGDLHPGAFTVQMVPRAPHTTLELEEALYEELEGLVEEPPTPAELKRVRNQLEAGRVRRLESNFGLAYQLAVSESMYGDWQTTFEFTDRLQAVTDDDIVRVVERYFTPERRTVTTLVTEERDDGPGGAP